MLEDKRLLRVKEVLKVFPVSLSTWKSGVKAGTYPHPVRLSSHTIAWRAADIEALIDKTVSMAKKARS